MCNVKDVEVLILIYFYSLIFSSNEMAWGALLLGCHGDSCGCWEQNVILNFLALMFLCCCSDVIIEGVGHTTSASYRHRHKVTKWTKAGIACDLMCMSCDVLYYSITQDQPAIGVCFQ